MIKFILTFVALNVGEDDRKQKSFTVMSFNSLLIYKTTYYLQLYLDNYAYKIASKQMA